MRHLLVPLDGSAFGESALLLAGAIAARTGGTLELVTVNAPVAHPDISVALIRESEAALGIHARRYLERQAEELRHRFAISVHTAVLDGAASSAIAEYVRVDPPELIVMSTHGRSGPSRLFLGSVADRLVRELHCPFMLVRPAAPFATGELPAEPRVLVPLDGSPLAESVVDEVARLFPVNLATLHLLRVVAPAEVFPVGAPMQVPAMHPNLVEARLAAAEAYLERAAWQLRTAGWRTEHEVLTGWNPAVEVLRSADAHRCDLIAIATRGLGGVQRMLLGSVADKVIRGAATPVLVINPPAGASSHVLGERLEAASMAKGIRVGALPGAGEACSVF